MVVGLNGALQRTIVFAPPKGLKVGDVNRASSVGAGIGGKGQNVCVAPVSYTHLTLPTNLRV